MSRLHRFATAQNDADVYEQDCPLIEYQGRHLIKTICYKTEYIPVNRIQQNLWSHNGKADFSFARAVPFGMALFLLLSVLNCNHVMWS